MSCTCEEGTLLEVEARTGAPEKGNRLPGSPDHRYGAVHAPRCSAPDEVDVILLETKGNPNLDVEVENVKEPKLKSESRSNRGV